MATKIVGLDLGSHTIKVCEVVSTVRKYELVGFGTESVDFAESDQGRFTAYANAAKRLLERRGLLNETIMCSLPAGLASTVELQLPFDQPKKIEAILPFQLEEVIPLDIDDVVYDYQVLNKNEDETSTIVCAYVRELDIAELLDALQGVGLDPKRISFGPLSFGNLFEHLLSPHENEAVALLDIGHVHSELVIFENGVPRVVRDISYGGLDVTRHIAAALQVSEADAERAKCSEALISSNQTATLDERQQILSDQCRKALQPLVVEIHRSIAAFELEKGVPISAVYSTGGSSRLRGLGQFIEDTVRIPCRTLKPLDAHFSRITTDRETNEPLLAKAMAISVQAFARQLRNQVNLRQGDYSYTGDFGFLRGRIITVTLAVMLMITLGAMVAVTKKRVLEAEHSRLRGEVAVLSQEILGTENDDVDFLLTTVSADREAADRGIPEFSALRLLAEISEAVDPNIKVNVDSIEIDIERKSLSIRGKTGSTSDVDNIVRALRQNRCFRQTEINRNEKSMDDELGRRFRITGKLTCS
ncbi:MAG: pilus assembly protein PilM [Myxococcota bacterium]|nr:pilus assembly protein PilM [Myxococcota bacterium]